MIKNTVVANIRIFCGIGPQLLIMEMLERINRLFFIKFLFLIVPTVLVFLFVIAAAQASVVIYRNDPAVTGQQLPYKIHYSLCKHTQDLLFCKLYANFRFRNPTAFGADLAAAPKYHILLKNSSGKQFVISVCLIKGRILLIYPD